MILLCISNCICYFGRFVTNFISICVFPISLRSTGSCAQNMAMVALGGTDANFEFGIHAWDMAAGYLIVTEAGGVVIDPAGTKLCVCKF